MISLTQKEREAILMLFKDFSTFYNANSISKILGISHVGAQKIFKRLLNGGALESKKIGKSIVYKLKLEDNYINKLVVFLLADEANRFKRWEEEFKELFKEGRTILIYGSMIKDYAKAKDIDIMIVMEMNKRDIKEVNGILKEKEGLLPKKIHAIKLTYEDLLKNIKGKNKAIIDIIKNAIVIYGQDKYMEVIKNVSRF